MRRLRAIVVLGLLLSLAAQAEGKKLTLLVTGDNRGEIATCGCAHNPAGGLARLKTVIDQARAQGPVLVLDAGHALFKTSSSDDAVSKKKAEFILKTMGELGAIAMAVGSHDLSGGIDFLRNTAKKAKVKVLSSNLTLKGKLAFEPSTVVTVGEARIGLVGIGPAAGSVARVPGLVGGPPVPAALAEAKKLREKVDAVVVLAAVPLADALELLNSGGDSIDLVLQSSDGRPPTVPQRSESRFLISTGKRGRVVSKVELDLTGQGPLVDMGQLDRDQQTVRLLDQQLAETEKRSAEARDAAVRERLNETLKSFRDRKAQVLAEISAFKGRAGRSFSLSPVWLREDIADDPALKAQVEKLQPPGSAKETAEADLEP